MSKQFVTFAGDKLRWSTRLPSTTVYTAMFWVKVNSASAVSKPFFYRNNNTGVPFTNVSVSTTNVFHLSYSPVTDPLAAYRPADTPTLTVGTWYHVAISVNDPSVVVYLNGVPNFSGARTGTFSSTNDMLFFGNNDDADAKTGLCSMAAIKVWDGIALNQDQVQAEMFTTWAQLRDQLLFEAPLDSGLNPYTADGQAWDTFAGTLEDVPPDTVELWEPARRRRVGPAAAAAARAPNRILQANQSLFAVY